MCKSMCKRLCKNISNKKEVFVNEYENKIAGYTSSPNLDQIKKEFFKSIKENNEKDVILDPEDAELLSIFIKKILSELNIRQ